MKKTLIFLAILILTISIFACGPEENSIQLQNLDDVVYIGDEIPLSITVGGAITSVNIYLGEGDEDPEPIESGFAVTEGDNTYTWTVSDESLGSEYYIQVVDAATEGLDNEIDDKTSDFAILDPNKTTIKLSWEWEPSDHTDGTKYGLGFYVTGTTTLEETSNPGIWQLPEVSPGTVNLDGELQANFLSKIELEGDPVLCEFGATPTENSDIIFMVGSNNLYINLRESTMMNQDFTSTGLYEVAIVDPGDGYGDVEVTAP
jgi:hypothetical protein